MSNKNVDERIVQMKFDNQNFERNAHQTMSTIDRLKQKLNFKGAVQGMEELRTVVEDMNMDGLAHSVGIVSAKFSAMEVVAITAISRITNKVIDLGERLVKSLSIDQLSAGWSKYEDKVTSVQTIMAATASTWEENARKIGFAGTQMEFANEQLEKLNWFSDETSFSFTDMTSNIGKFTSAGIALDKSVTAMEGISVWAAKSGQNAQSASRAYYNLAQAISVGAVKLMDWKSIENANMATMEFKQTAIDTALAIGTLKKAGEGVFETLKGHEVTVRNFNENLKDEWFTSEVLMETLNKYGKAATRLSEISDTYNVTATEFLSSMEDYNEGNASIADISKDLGLSAETLIPLFKELSSEEYKLSLSAFKAAQEAKTFSEVLNATKDAVSTGWMNTFELIFGNYEETKKLWSAMAEQFYDIFAGGAEGRNSMIKEVLGDPWEQLQNKIMAAGLSSEAFEKKLADVMRNAGVPVDALLEKWGTIEEVFKHVDGIGQYVKQTILSFTEPIQQNVDAITNATTKLEDFQKVVNKVIRGEFKSGKERVKNLTEAGYDYATVQGLVNKVWEKNGHTWKDTTITMDDLVSVMGNMTTEELKQVGLTKEQVEAFEALQEEARETGTDLDLLIQRMTKPTGRQLIFSSLLNVVEAFKVALQTIKDAWSIAFPPKSDSVIYRIIEGFHTFTEWLIMSEEQSARVAKALSGIFNILGIIVDIISAIIKTIFPGVSKGARKAGDVVLSFFEKFADGTAKVREFINSSNMVSQAIQLIIKYVMKTIDAVKSFISKAGDIPIVGKTFDTLSDKVKKIFDFFRNTFGDFFTSITKENADLETSIVNLFNTIKKKVEEIIDKVPFLGKVKDTFINVLNTMKQVGEYFSEGFWQGLKKSSKFIFDKIVGFITKIKDKIWDLFDIHSPSGWSIETVWLIARGVVEGLIQVTRWLVDRIRNFVRKLMGVTESVAKDIPGALANGVESETNPVIDALKNLFGNVKEFISAFLAWVKDGVVTIIDYIKDIPFETLYNIIKEIISILYVLAAIKMFFNIGSGMKKIGEAFETIGEAIKGFLKTKQLKQLGKVAISFAIAIGIIAGAIIALSKLGGENLDQAANILLSAMIVLGVVLSVIMILDNISIALNRVNLKKGLGAGKGSAMSNMALLLISISASMVLIMVAITQLLNLMKTTDTTTLSGAIGNLLALFGFLIVIVELLNMLNSRAFGKQNGALKSVGAILAVIIGINLIIKTINKYFFTTNENGEVVYNQKYADAFLQPLNFMVGLLLAIGGVLAIITGAAGKWGLKGAGFAILAMALSLVIIVEVVNNLYEKLSQMSGKEFIVWGSIFIAVLAILGVMLLGVAEITKTIKTKNVATGYLAITLFAGIIIAFIAVVAYIVKAISESNASDGEKIGALVGVVISVIALLAAIGVFLNLMEKRFSTPAKIKHMKDIILGVSGLMAMLAVLIGAIAGSMLLVSINNNVWSSFAALIFGLVIALAAVGTFIFVMNKLKIGSMKDAIISVGLVAGLIVAIGGTLAVLTAVAKDNVGGLIASGVILTLITGIMLGIVKIMSTMTAFNGASVGMMLSLAVVIGVLAYSLYELSKVNPKVLEHTATVIGILVFALVAAVTAVGYVASLSPAITGTVVVIAGSVAAILFMLTMAFNAIKDFLLVLGVFMKGDEFATSMAKVFAAEKIGGFTDAINGASDSVVTAMDNMSNAFDGVGTSMADLMQNGADFFDFFKNNPVLAEMIWGERIAGKLEHGADLTKLDKANYALGFIGASVKEGSPLYNYLATDKDKGGEIVYVSMKEPESYKKSDYYKELYEATKDESYNNLYKIELAMEKGAELLERQAKRREQEEKDKEFLKDGNNGLSYSKQMEQQMRENSKALVEGAAVAINDAGESIGTAAGNTVIDKLLDVVNNGAIGGSFLNGDYAAMAESFMNYSGENGIKVDSSSFEGVSFYDADYQKSMQDTFAGFETVPSDMQGFMNAFQQFQQTQSSNNQDLTAALNNLSGMFSGNNEVTLNLDGNVLGQIMVPYVNNGLAKIFVQSNR